LTASKPLWRIRIPDTVIAEAKKRGISVNMALAAKKAFEGLAFVRNPKAMAEVLLVRETHGEWHRYRDDAKIPGIRIIFEISPYNTKAAENSGLLGTLVMKAILPKDGHTYEIVYQLWLAEN
jgi:hypothetical protein